MRKAPKMRDVICVSISDQLGWVREGGRGGMWNVGYCISESDVQRCLEMGRKKATVLANEEATVCVGMDISLDG